MPSSAAACSTMPAISAGLGHVRRRVGSPHAARFGDVPAQPFDLAGIAEAVEQDVGPRFGQFSSDAKADAAG